MNMRALADSFNMCKIPFRGQPLKLSKSIPYHSNLASRLRTRERPILELLELIYLRLSGGRPFLAQQATGQHSLCSVATITALCNQPHRLGGGTNFPEASGTVGFWEPVQVAFDLQRST